eukprot:COSAG02_NODE_5074_length_4664_cov_17.061117_5_plen_102_part_00
MTVLAYSPLQQVRRERYRRSLCVLAEDTYDSNRVRNATAFLILRHSCLIWRCRAFCLANTPALRSSNLAACELESFARIVRRSRAMAHLAWRRKCLARAAC